LVAIGCATALFLKNDPVFIAIVAVAGLLLLLLRRRADGVSADERDRETAGQAARIAMLSIAYAALAGACALFLFRDTNPAYPIIAATLGYMAAAMLIVYSLSFRWLNHFQFTKLRWLYLTLASILVLVIAVAALRLYSGEDDWMSQNGKWVMHGHPDFPAPQQPCK